MKKTFGLLMFLVIIYLIIQSLLFFLGSGYEINYVIDNEFQIFEKYTKNTKNEHDNYLFKIQHNNKIYSFQTYSKLNTKTSIKEIKIFNSDEMECILPIFTGNKIIFDVTCNVDGTLVYYHNMNNKPKKLEEFVDNLPYYSSKQFTDATTSINKDLFNIYKDNFIDNHNFSLTNYKGILTVNKRNSNKISNIDIFTSDKYSREISAFTTNYYIVANYDEKYEFTKFYTVNLKNSTLKTIKDTYKISFDSYIQGIIGDKVYLFDIDNKVQYQIDAKTSNITEVGNMNTGIKYYDNGTWSRVELNKAIKDKLLFKLNSYRKILDNGDIIDTIGNKKSGYIYKYKKVSDGYSLYVSNVLIPDIETYLFEINEIDKIKYIDNYIYFKNNNTINYYHQEYGLKKLVISEELTFNKNIDFSITK